jgi:hypothetical protein
MANASRETVRAYDMSVIGYIDTLPNGDKEVRDRANRYLGKYDKHLNVTKDRVGRMIYRGDQSSMLFNEK